MKVIFLFLMCLPLWSIGQLKNGAFEDWPENSEESPYVEELTLLGVKNPMAALPDDWSTSESPFGVCRVENNCSGEYGLLIFSWYYGEPGSLKTTFTLDSKPTALQGCYQYISFDTLEGSFENYAKIVLWSKGDTIGSAYFSFPINTDFNNFEIPFSYTSDLLPDSMSILFYSDVLGSTEFPANGLLFLDDLNLVYSITPTSRPLNENDFNIYPNPLKNDIFIDCQKTGAFYFELYNLKGQLFDTGALVDTSNRLQTQHLPKGVYILNIINDNKEVLTRKFIKK